LHEIDFLDESQIPEDRYGIVYVGGWLVKYYREGAFYNVTYIK